MLFNVPLARNLGLVLNQQHPYSLHVGGFDVILKVPYESVSIVEAGPGGVSSLSFDIEDPDSSIDIADGAEVRMWDVTRDLPMFLGFVEVPEYELWAAVGRTIHVSAYGIESLLDSTIVPSLTIDTLQSADDGGLEWEAPQVLQVIAGLTPLRQFQAFFKSNQAGPVQFNGYAVQNLTPTSLSGMTIRGAFEAWTDASEWAVEFGHVKPGWALTVDPWGGVRLWATGVYVGAASLPTDYAPLTIDNSPSGALACDDLKYSRDTSPGAIVNAVYVQGAAAASTGWVVGDTTTGRHEAYTTTSGTSEEDKQGAAAAVMVDRETPVGRGSLVLLDFQPTNVHPGSLLTITDSRMGWAARQFVVTELSRIITPGSTYQTWTVNFMDADMIGSAGPASATRFIRTLTRGTHH